GPRFRLDRGNAGKGGARRPARRGDPGAVQAADRSVEDFGDVDGLRSRGGEDSRDDRRRPAPPWSPASPALRALTVSPRPRYHLVTLRSIRHLSLPSIALVVAASTAI